jgi:glycerophosphoryl diester phosphodiesterase
VDDRALICSASLTALSKLRDLNPLLKTVFSCAGREAELGALEHIGVSGVFLARDVSEGSMTLAAEKGLKLYVRTDERQAMARLVQRGVTGLVTPRPDLLRNLFPPS